MKSTHDLIRESLEEKAQTPATTTEAGERAGSQKLANEKNLSKGAMPSFQFREAEDIPSMPRLSGMAVRMPGCANTLQASFQNANPDNVRREMGDIRRSRMSKEDQEQFYSMLGEVRSETIKFLDCLIRYDDGIHMDNIKHLQHAMIIIAGGVVIHD